jgi:predicted acyl esterase
MYSAPRFDVNPNTGGPLGRDQSYRLAHQTVHHDADCPSHIVLPIQDGRGDESA